jgi:hypothetical protein
LPLPLPLRIRLAWIFSPDFPRLSAVSGALTPETAGADRGCDEWDLRGEAPGEAPGEALMVGPVIAPDDPDRVTAELAAHGVNVTRGPESGLR